MTVKNYPDSNSMAAPARHAFAITPTNGADLSTPTRGIMCSADSTLVVRFEGDAADVTLLCSAKVYYPFALTQVQATGTTLGGTLHGFH